MVTAPLVTLRMLKPTVGIMSSWKAPVAMTLTRDVLPAFCSPIRESSISFLKNRLPKSTATLSAVPSQAAAIACSCQTRLRSHSSRLFHQLDIAAERCAGCRLAALSLRGGEGFAPAVVSLSLLPCSLLVSHTRAGELAIAARRAAMNE